MDNERELRAELMTALSPAFECREHVRVRHVIFENKVLTADVIAVPRDDAFASLTLAFEVKDPVVRTGVKGVYDVPYWTRAIHQASDYVYATVERTPEFHFLEGRRVSSAFVFPTTCLAWLDPRRTPPDHYQALMRIKGAFELGVHSRVGKASWETYLGGRARRLDLWLGNDVWRSDVGFRPNALGVLKGKRPLGSQQVDVLKELVGIEAPPLTSTLARSDLP